MMHKYLKVCLTILLGYILSGCIISPFRDVQLVPLVFASDSHSNDINFIEVWQWNGSDYVLEANFTSTGGSCLVEEKQAIKVIVSIKLNDTLASSEAEAIEYTRVYMNISEGIWTDEELNQTSCVHSGDFYWLKENGVWNQTGYPQAGVDYECSVLYQGNY